MIRYAFALTLALGAIAGVAAAVEASAARTVSQVTHETVVEKNSPFPVLGPIIVEECATEDCSEIQS